MLKSCFTALSIVSLSTSLCVSPSNSEPLGNNGISKQREIHNAFSGDQEKGTMLDATNPMDLINRLRRATAMDDATSPSDAIDDALKALDSKQIENSSSQISNPSESSILRRRL